ncbi:MAG: response regulator transcription factor [Anaerolineaceae bacterium]|nr:response regulator transcription factor [Anaerolineaceae bacterium]
MLVIPSHQVTGSFQLQTALHLPQVAEANTPRSMDVTSGALMYDEIMTRVLIADARPEERSALRLLLLDMNMEVVGEAADWSATLTAASACNTEMLLVDWDLLPSEPNAALQTLRDTCPAALVIVLISHLTARQQAALSAGADAFISKGETPERVAERLRTVAASLSVI